jgi:two-component system, OmpR family, sensor histidine kinase KdpD
VLYQLSQTGKTKQYFISAAVVVLVSLCCYFLSDFIGYQVVAFILLLTVSLIAMVFDIFPVMLAALLSALIWDFFFIPPRFTFRVGSAEDSLLLLMYFVIALIHAVLTNRIRRIEKIAREKEEKANTIKLYDTLLNSLSHELKTPIATIVGATDNLLNEPAGLSEENKKNLVTEISIASLRLNQQVENLLSMSRLESDVIRLKKDWCDINELIYDVVNRLESNLANHPVKISLEENLPLYKLDYGLMEQVLYNLLYNATLYTPSFSDIHIIAKNNADRLYQLNEVEEEQSPVAKEINYLVLIIEDKGPGFPEDELDRVFDKFYRLKHSATGGTGLGLSIVKGFVEAHDGTITLENIPHGSRFTIEIPAETSYINNMKNE